MIKIKDKDVTVRVISGEEFTGLCHDVCEMFVTLTYVNGYDKGVMIHIPIDKITVIAVEPAERPGAEGYREPWHSK